MTDTPGTTTTIIDAIERNVDGLLQHLPLSTSQLTLATFAASAVLKFIRVGQEIRELGEAKQRELSQRLRDQIRPTLRTQPDPDLQLRREMERFFIVDGRPNRELRRQPFRPLSDAFGDLIELLAANDRNHPDFSSAVQDLTFVFSFMRPALGRNPARFEDEVLQEFFGMDIASRDPLRLQGILNTVREGSFEQYEHTPNWYRTNIEGFLYWQLASRHSLQLAEDAFAEIQQQLDDEARTLLVDAIFGDQGLLDQAAGTLGAFKDAKKQEAIGGIDDRLSTIAERIATLEADRTEEKARLDIQKRRLTLDLEDARAEGHEALVVELETEIAALDAGWRRREIDFDEDLLDAEAEQRALEQEKAELENV